MNPQGIAPTWFVITTATLVALVLIGGTIALLLVGRSVPDRLWDLDIAVGVAYFGGGPFSVAMSHAQHVAAGLMETANHAIAALREAVGRTTGAGPSGEA